MLQQRPAGRRRHQRLQQSTCTLLRERRHSLRQQHRWCQLRRRHRRRRRWHHRQGQCSSSRGRWRRHRSSPCERPPRRRCSSQRSSKQSRPGGSQHLMTMMSSLSMTAIEWWHCLKLSLIYTNGSLADGVTETVPQTLALAAGYQRPNRHPHSACTTARSCTSTYNISFNRLPGIHQ